MKPKSLNKVALTAIIALSVITSVFSQVGVNEMADELETQSQGAFRIVNIIMTVIMFAGIIYIAIGLISKRETSKGVIVGWVVAMVIWGIAVALLT